MVKWIWSRTIASRRYTSPPSITTKHITNQPRPKSQSIRKICKKSLKKFITWLRELSYRVTWCPLRKSVPMKRPTRIRLMYSKLYSREVRILARIKISYKTKQISKVQPSFHIEHTSGLLSRMLTSSLPNGERSNMTRSTYSRMEPTPKRLKYAKTWMKAWFCVLWQL